MRYHVKVKNTGQWIPMWAWCVDHFDRQQGPTSKLRYYSLVTPEHYFKLSFANKDDAVLFALRWS